MEDEKGRIGRTGWDFLSMMVVEGGGVMFVALDRGSGVELLVLRWWKMVV